MLNSKSYFQWFVLIVNVKIVLVSHTLTGMSLFYGYVILLRVCFENVTLIH